MLVDARHVLLIGAEVRIKDARQHLEGPHLLELSPWHDDAWYFLRNKLREAERLTRSAVELLEIAVTK